MLIPVSIDLDFIIRKRNDTVYLETNFTGNGKYFTAGLTKMYSSTTDLETNEYKICVFDNNLIITTLVKPQYREIFNNNDILSSTLLLLSKDDKKYKARVRIFIYEESFIHLK